MTTTEFAGESGSTTPGGDGQPTSPPPVPEQPTYTPANPEAEVPAVDAEIGDQSSGLPVEMFRPTGPLPVGSTKGLVAQEETETGSEGVAARTASAPATGSPTVSVVSTTPAPASTPGGRPLPYPVIAAAPASGSGDVKLFDAETGLELWAATPFPLTGKDKPDGIRVALADVTRDGYPDLVAVGGPGGTAQVVTYDGKTGKAVDTPLASFAAFDGKFDAGLTVAAGDLTGDGRPDVVVASDEKAPRVRVFDGNSGKLVSETTLTAPEFKGGVRLAVGEFVPTTKAAELVVASGHKGGLVQILDAATLSPISGPLGSMDPFAGDAKKGVSVATGDVTGDGKADLIVGAGAGHAPEVRVYDGVTGGLAWSALAFDAKDKGGITVGAAWVSDDVYADVVVGSGHGDARRVVTLDGVSGKPLAGPVASFDPGMGAKSGGVEVTAANDPLPQPYTPVQPTRGGRGYNYAGYRTFFPGDAAIVSHKLYATLDPYPSSPPAPYTPTGTVTYKGFHLEYPYETKEFGTVALVDSKSGYATATLSISAPDWYGTWDLFPYYSGDSNFASYISNESAVIVIADPAKPPALCPDLSCFTATTVVEDDSNVVGPVPPQKTPEPVRYADGVIQITAPDLTAGGFGAAWGQSRTWSNNPGYSVRSAVGNGWVVSEQPHLERDGSSIILIENGTQARYFDTGGSGYTSRFADGLDLSYDGTGNEFVLTDGVGNVLRFYGFDLATSPAPGGTAGTLISRTSPGGEVTSFEAWDEFGRPTEVRRSVTVGAVTTIEALVTEYLSPIDGFPQAMSSATLQRKVGSGSWTTVRKVAYSYYGTGDSNGTPGDLKLATVTDANDSVIDRRYYRYFTTYLVGGVQTGYPGGLRYEVGPEAYARIAATTDPATASNEVIAAHADRAFKYDSSHRAVEETVSAAGCSACSAGFGTYGYAYTTSGNADGHNSWKTKTVETLPDGNQNTIYTNVYGQVMLKAYRDATTGQVWTDLYRYDDEGRLLWHARPSAFVTYDDPGTGGDDSATQDGNLYYDGLADLIDYDGNSPYLADHAGLIDRYAYYDSSATGYTAATSSTAGGVHNYLKSENVQRGEQGTPVVQRGLQYFTRTDAGGNITYPVATSTAYRGEDGSGAQTTSYAYTWHGTTSQASQITTTLPTVTTAQNGPNAATTTVAVFDTFGRQTWFKDQDGYITRMTYDDATGAVTSVTTDVNTAVSTDEPSGWTTPSGGGLHLTTAYEVDDQGRATKVTGPDGRVTFTVFNDPGHEVRTYPGWDATTNKPTGPITVTRDDRANGYSETFTLAASTATSSSGRPTGAETYSSSP